MGTWGSGNFENDKAGDYFLTVIDRMTDEIRQVMQTEQQIHAGNRWGDITPCMIEMITVLGQQRFHCLCLDIDEIKQWKQIYMDRWTSTIDSCRPDEDYRKEREKILNDTFDKLIAYAEKE